MPDPLQSRINQALQQNKESTEKAMQAYKQWTFIEEQKQKEKDERNALVSLGVFFGVMLVAWALG